MRSHGIGLVVMAMAVIACSTSNTPSGERLASDQSLRFSIQNDIQTLDPGQAGSSVDITFIQEIFSGLYRFDDQLRIVPDLAASMPQVSSDEKTYTFKLRKDGKFWSGGPITARDVLYSWNRAAYMNGSYANVFDPVEGASEVHANKTKFMSGLTNPDDYTVVAKLAEPAGYWPSELALWAAAVVNQGVIGDYADPSNKRNDGYNRDTGKRGRRALDQRSTGSRSTAFARSSAEGRV